MHASQSWLYRVPLFGSTHDGRRRINARMAAEAFDETPDIFRIKPHGERNLIGFAGAALSDFAMLMQPSERSALAGRQLDPHRQSVL